MGQPQTRPPQPLVMRLRDQKIFAASPQLSKRRDFVIVNPDGSYAPTQPGLNVPEPELRLTPAPDMAVSERFAAFDDLALGAYVTEECGMTPPANATRDQLLHLIQVFGPERGAKAGPDDPNQVPSSDPPVDAAPSGDPLDSLTKNKLAELAKTKYAYEMSPNLTKAQMITELHRLQGESK